MCEAVSSGGDASPTSSSPGRRTPPPPAFRRRNRADRIGSAPGRRHQEPRTRSTSPHAPGRRNRASAAVSRDGRTGRARRGARAHPETESQPSERRWRAERIPSLVIPSPLSHTPRTHALRPSPPHARARSRLLFAVSLTLSPRLFSYFVLFLLNFRAVPADTSRMYKQLLLSSLLLTLDIVALRMFALQPEALIFAALAIATLPFFLSSALALRGE